MIEKYVINYIYETYPNAYDFLDKFDSQGKERVLNWSKKDPRHWVIAKCCLLESNK